jgi:SAM-dependent methyltransferase
MNPLSALRNRIKRWPSQGDRVSVQEMTSQQWRNISTRTPTYLKAYRDNPGGNDRAQRRARWVAARPIFEAATSVLEVGCGAARNLAELYRSHAHLALTGADINAEALEVARVTVPHATLILNNLYDLGHDWRPEPVDVVLTVGVLVHLEPLSLHWVLKHMLVAAPVLVLVEEIGEGELAKGPKSWGAAKATGSYAMWKPNLPMFLRVLGAGVEVTDLPEDLQAPGATHLVVGRRQEATA